MFSLDYKMMILQESPIDILIMTPMLKRRIPLGSKDVAPNNEFILLKYDYRLIK
jgi:hypothetical protein